MCALRPKNSALTRRIRDLEKKLDAVNDDIKGFSKVVRKAEHAGVAPVFSTQPVQKNVEPDHVVPVQQETRMSASVLAKPSVEYSQPRVQSSEPAVKKPFTDKDNITRDDRFATYLMSRDFHNVRPLRHERFVQRNKAIVMVVIAVIILLYLVMRFIP